MLDDTIPCIERSVRLLYAYTTVVYATSPTPHCPLQHQDKGLFTRSGLKKAWHIVRTVTVLLRQMAYLRTQISIPSFPRSPLILSRRVNSRVCDLFPCTGGVNCGSSYSLSHPRIRAPLPVYPAPRSFATIRHTARLRTCKLYRVADAPATCCFPLDRIQTTSMADPTAHSILQVLP